MRTLVTGGNGFIGSHLVDALLAENCQVVILDHRSNPFYPIPNGVIFVQAELNNRGAVREALQGVDVVFHLAWSGVHLTSNQDLRGHVETNLLPTLGLFELSLEMGIERIVFISSGGTVYGKTSKLPIAEDHPTNPICAYGIAKLSAEKYLELYGYLHGLDYVILRPSVPYGERQDPWGIQGAVAVFLGKMLHKEPITIWGDGTTVRDFFYVGDLAQACWLAGTTLARRQVLNVGGGQGVTLIQLVDALRQVTGSTVSVDYQPERLFDVPELVLDIGKAKQCLGWRPRVGLMEGLSRTWMWIKTIA